MSWLSTQRPWAERESQRAWMRPSLVPDADAGGGTFQRGLGDAEAAVGGLGNVVGAGHVGPHLQEFALTGEDLYPAVLPVADVNQPLLINQQAVGQVELSRAALARLAPRRNEPPVAAEAVHPAVAVAIGDVQVAGG